MRFDFDFNNGITNYELLSLAKRMKIKIIVGMKDNININKIGGYIINLESKKDNGFGSHWVALYKIDKNNYIYYDSFGIIPPLNLVEKLKFNKDVKLYYNSTHIQDLKSRACGFYALLFLYYIEDYINDMSINDLFDNFTNLFYSDTKFNDERLYEIYENIFKLRDLK